MSSVNLLSAVWDLLTGVLRLTTSRADIKSARAAGCLQSRCRERLLPDNLLVRIHFIIKMIWWTGLAPWEFEFPFLGSLDGLVSKAMTYLCVSMIFLTLLVKRAPFRPKVYEIVPQTQVVNLRIVSRRE